jgi:hypothetical protein
MASGNGERADAAKRLDPPEARSAGRGTASLNATNHRPRQAPVAIIDTTRTHQVRLFVSTWRDRTTLEFRPYSESVPGVPMPCGAGVSFPIEKLPELLEALHAIEEMRAGP